MMKKCILLFLVTAVACSKERLGDGLQEQVSCNNCHGGDTNDAPPPSVQGFSDASIPAVGAHQSHLRAGYFGPAFSCEDCHQVPDSILSPGHIDPLPAEVVMSGLAASGGLQPVYDSQTHTCSSVWCHGAALRGGSNTNPVWNRVGEGEAVCGSCHGVPPPPPHLQHGACWLCHPESVGADGYLLRGGKHLDGSIEVRSQACDSCHGEEGNPAPPPDLQGNRSFTAPGVGAHRQHLQPSNWHRQIDCGQCHLIPVEVGSAGHLDASSGAEVIFGQLASADDARPVYNRSGWTCSGVYCHGATLKGEGSNRQPVWTEVGVGQAACGACHTLPPRQGHPQLQNCALCHPCVVDSSQQIIRPELHINGQVNLETGDQCPSE
jgi:predicted CxxxxCH...CXXCH cytochrome family protein